MDVNLLHPFEAIRSIGTGCDPRRAGPLRLWQLLHNAFLLGQPLGPPPCSPVPDRVAGWPAAGEVAAGGAAGLNPAMLRLHTGV
jgi:hypothetical protein